MLILNPIQHHNLARFLPYPYRKRDAGGNESTMLHTENHETFLSFGELFSRSAERFLEAEREVRNHLNETDPPYRQAIELVADAEHQLAIELAEYAEKGPENIVCTRVQYKLQSNPPPTPSTIGDALKNITEINMELTEVLQDLSEKVAPETLQQTIETLRRDVEQANKQISMIRLTVQDI